MGSRYLVQITLADDGGGFGGVGKGPSWHLTTFDHIREISEELGSVGSPFKAQSATPEHDKTAISTFEFIKYSKTTYHLTRRQAVGERIRIKGQVERIQNQHAVKGVPS